jgi:hypothetical protein
VTLTRAWHATTALVGLVALVGQTVVSATDGDSLANLFSYFTIQSNVLVVVTCALLAAWPGRSGTAFGMLRLASLTGIAVTGVVYAVLLAGNVELNGAEWWFDKIFHYVVPVAAVVGFVALRPRTRLAWSALGGLAFPVAWLVYTLVRASVVRPTFTLTPATTARVPYDFLDTDALGAGTVAVTCVVLTLAFVALGSAAIAWSRRV